ncbi:MAG TPA: sulfotransferase [Allosphingosinicella sp.]|nr:sulfotransferase [Allosphingosinicella sp.]
MIGHLIHIGYPKTGSTFLRRWFAGHPQLAYQGGGIAGFANVHAIAVQSAAPREGLMYRVTSSEGLAAPDAHAEDGLDSFDRTGPGQDPREQALVCRALAELFPNAHVLVVTRGFRSAIYSGYSEYVRAGGDADLGRFFKMTRAVVDKGRGVLDYDYLIDLYRERFGDRLIVMPYELLRDDPKRFALALEEQLGLTHHPPDVRRENPSLSPEELGWYPRLARVVRRLPFGGRLRRRLLARQAHDPLPRGLRPLAGLLTRTAPSAAVSPALITEEMVAFLRGRAERLRGHPLYLPYAKDYLL